MEKVGELAHDSATFHETILPGALAAAGVDITFECAAWQRALDSIDEAIVASVAGELSGGETTLEPSFDAVLDELTALEAVVTAEGSLRPNGSA